MDTTLLDLNTSLMYKSRKFVISNLKIKTVEQTLKNKVVIVTGASKGIGAGIAREAAAAGAKVVVNYSSSKEGADQVVNEITSQGGLAIAVQGDMSKKQDVQNLFRVTKEIYGKVDTVINNAGVYEFAPIELFDEDSYRRMFDINVLGILLTSQEAVRAFGKKGGSIVNITSYAGTRPDPYSIVYGASKAAADALTISMSQELGPKNIRVNSVRPGGVYTEGVKKLGLEIDSESITETVKRSALGRMAIPEDIGKMAVFFASDQSSIITGQTVEVSGGYK